MPKARKITTTTTKAAPAAKPVSKPVPPVKPVAVAVPAKPVKPVAVPPVAVPAVPAANVVTSAAKLAAIFCRKALAGPSKTAANGLSVRDSAYLRLLSITAKRTKTLSPRVIDIADDYVTHAANLFAGINSKPVLDDSVLRGRLPSLGLISQPANADDPSKATITLTAAATKLAIYTSA